MTTNRGPVPKASDQSGLTAARRLILEHVGPVEPPEGRFLDVVLRGGTRVALPYRDFVWSEYFDEVPATHKGRLLLHFRDHVVEVRGVRLRTLSEGVATRALRQLRVSGPGAGLKDKEGPVMHGLRVIDRD